MRMTMVDYKPAYTSINNLLNQRWVRLAYAVFAVALLGLAALQRADVIIRFPLTLGLLLVLLATGPITGMLIGRTSTPRGRLLAWPLLIIDACAALGLVAATGGYASPMWVGLLLVSTAAPLLLPGQSAAVLIVALWLADGVLILQAPPLALAEALMTWALRVICVALVGLVLRRALASEEGLRLRAQRREQVLHDFLLLSNRLRITSQPQTILDEVARAVQASGDFDCVTLSRVEWRAATVTVAVAIGASGRRLSLLEHIVLPWNEFAPLLSEQRRAGPTTFRANVLPFRHIKREQHLILPLNSQFGEVQGLLTVSCPQQRSESLDEAMPLLELLANQAAAALDNSTLYSTLEERVREATATITRSQEELAIARDRAETLYQIVRTLAGSLDEREVLAQALALVSQATSAELGGIMLVEPNTGRLAFRTTSERERTVSSAGLDRGQELAGLVLASRQPALIPDIYQDSRWRTRSEQDERIRSVLAVPLLLDEEPLGVLLLTHSHPDHFRQEHRQLALAAAGQIAVALSKAQLYRYVSEQSERLGLMLQQRDEEVSKSQAILRSIGDGVAVSDRLGRIKMLNPAAEQMLGISADQFLGRQIGDLAGAPENGRAEAGGLEQLRVGERTLRAHYAPVLSSSGEWLGSVIVYHDLTREALMDKLKSEFIATASHELRTPLTAIRGYVDLLLLGTFGTLTQPQNEFLMIVKNNVARLVELIDDLLDISKAEAGEIRLRRELVDVAEVLYEVAESLYTQFSDRSISLAIDVAETLPKVPADRKRLRQIMVNLIGNACKYTPNGGRVDVMLHSSDSWIQVDVRDTGVGIPEAAQPLIFTRFFRADNPLRDAAGGTGLGLNITKTLVDLHGGQIWFESHEGSGSVFSFTLPATEDEWKPAEWLDHVDQRPTAL